jgi:hypothetical protein
MAAPWRLASKAGSPKIDKKNWLPPTYGQYISLCYLPCTNWSLAVPETNMGSNIVFDLWGPRVGRPNFERNSAVIKI